MPSGPHRKGRQLSPEEKWQVFLEVCSQQLTQADAARKWGVDVSTVIKLRRLAKDGALAAFAASRPGRPASIEQIEIQELRAENARLSEALRSWRSSSRCCGKAALGLFGPVPGRVSAETKLELLGLIDAATAAGWPHVRACQVLELADVRAHRWRARLRETGTLEDRPPVGAAVHRILAWEEQAILELIEQWGWVDRSHRKLAHRGSYTGTVFVSPSTLLRVALKHRLELPGEPFRRRPAKPALPELPWERNRIWIWDAGPPP